MRGKLGRSVAWPAGGLAVTGLLWLLGRLKLLYYHGAFGVSLGSLDLAHGDPLFESWFVAQNVLFVVLLWWIALKTRAIWVACVAVAHALIPIASHYAFAFPDAPPADFLIHYRHTLLKLVPFGVLALVWLLQPRHRETLRSLRSPLTGAGQVLFVLVALSWAISAAKHFGSFDAHLVMRDPAAHLTRVRMGPRGTPPSPPAELFLLHANRESLVLWDHTGFVYGRTPEVRVLTVPRSSVEWIEGRKAFGVQPGDRFL